MRTALVVLSLAYLAVGASACSLGGDEVSAKVREQEVVEVVEEAFPLARTALDGTDLQVDGKWNSCPGGVGHRFEGGGVLTAPEGAVAEQLEAVRTALTDAGFEDVTQVEGHVSVKRDEVSLDIRQPSASRGPDSWPLSFQGPCRRYSGDDEEYVEQQNMAAARALLS